MAIRTLDDFEAHVTEDLKWRLSELDTWEHMLRALRPHQQEAILRGGITLLYAHWEGFIKEAARAYLEYISRKGLMLGELRPELAAIALRAMLGKGELSKRSTDHTVIVEIIRNEVHNKANLPYGRSTIRTRSNLSFEVFEDIMHSLGCDSSRHEMARALIDSRLLKLRNEVAHGRELLVSIDDWLTIRERVLNMMKDVRTQLRNAAALEEYRRSATAPHLITGK